MAAQSVDVQDILNAHPFSFRQVTIAALCFAVVLLDGFDTAAIGYVAPSLLAEWGLERPALAPVLSAALFGLVVGSLSVGPVCDRIGRRWVLIASVLVMGIACLGSALSPDLSALVTWRFVTGIGLGAAMPTALTLVSEYCPARRRSLVTNLVFCGFPLGAALGGLLSAWLIPTFGWRSMLVVGGMAPLLLAVALLLFLPESVRFLVARGHGAERIRKVLAPIVPSAGTAQAFTIAEARPSTDALASIRLVLSRPFIIGTAMLWITYFMGLVIFYAMINWMPVLLRDTGLTPATAAIVASLFPLGGLGSLFSGLLMDRSNGTLIVAVCYGLTAVAFAMIGLIGGHAGALMALVLVAGVMMNTAQSSLGSLAAAFYPTSCRATGIAWMMGLGRFGGIAGSFLVAELASRQLSFTGLFVALSVPGLIAAAALWIKHLVGVRPTAPAAADPERVPG